MEYLSKKMIYLIISVLITLASVLYGIGQKGWDPIGQMFGMGFLPDATETGSIVINEVAKTNLDPSISMANLTAKAQNRGTTIEDVWVTLEGMGFISGSGTDAPAPIFTNMGDSITVSFDTVGVEGSCLITIDPASSSAIRTCI